jgi:putative component of membrane protein insertase Oxa1/YidC/SpoIIIJ protein YidD
MSWLWGHMEEINNYLHFGSTWFFLEDWSGCILKSENIHLMNTLITFIHTYTQVVMFLVIGRAACRYSPSCSQQDAQQYAQTSCSNSLTEITRVVYVSFDPLCGLVVRVPGYRSRGPGFDSRRYQNFWEVVGLERDPLSLWRIIEELLEGKSRGSGLERWD